MPPCARSNAPSTRLIAPVNAPFSWPNSALSTRPFGQRGAVQLDERPVAPVALRVNRAREQLLAGARLALEQHGRARRRGRRDGLQHATDRRAVADDLPLVPELHHLAAQPLVLAAQAHDLERLIDRELELLRPDGLRDVVDRAGLDRRDRVLDAAVAGQHDQRRLVPLLPAAARETRGPSAPASDSRR